MNVYLFIYEIIYEQYVCVECRYWIIAKTNMYTPWLAPLAGRSTIPLDNGAAWKLAGGCVGLDM